MNPLELLVRGPGFEARRVLRHGEPELVLGRDTDCAICLPDPQRNVSRRHLAVWNAQGELHFRVVSVVNGVQMPFGEAPPGARGVLPAGQVLTLADYAVSCTAMPSEGPADADPWAVFDREGSGVYRLPQGARGDVSAPIPAAEDDPFGDWGFETTFGPGGAGGGLEASKLGAAADLTSFYRGLGLDAERQALTEGELEALGRLVRDAMAGVLALRDTVGGTTTQLRAEDRTMLAPREANPLRSDWPLQAKLHYLFGGRAASGGHIAPERALREVLAELSAHEQATAAAARDAVAGTLGEFDPAQLKARLLGEGSKLFEAARAWDAFARDYAQQGQDMPAWVQRMLDKYFTAAYLRETIRLKRETGGRQR